jgi:hypothetical protein
MAAEKRGLGAGRHALLIFLAETCLYGSLKNLRELADNSLNDEYLRKVLKEELQSLERECQICVFSSLMESNIFTLEQLLKVFFGRAVSEFDQQ